MHLVPAAPRPAAAGRHLSNCGIHLLATEELHRAEHCGAHNTQCSEHRCVQVSCLLLLLFLLLFCSLLCSAAVLLLAAGCFRRHCCCAGKHGYAAASCLQITHLPEAWLRQASYVALHSTAAVYQRTTVTFSLTNAANCQPNSAADSCRLAASSRAQTAAKYALNCCSAAVV
jgi:hypothetical protein